MTKSHVRFQSARHVPIRRRRRRRRKPSCPRGPERLGHFKMPGETPNLSRFKIPSQSKERPIPGTAAYQGNDGFEGAETVPGKNMVLASRSKPRAIPGVGTLSLARRGLRKATDNSKLPPANGSVLASTNTNDDVTIEGANTSNRLPSMLPSSEASVQHSFSSDAWVNSGHTPRHSLPSTEKNIGESENPTKPFSKLSSRTTTNMESTPCESRI